MMHELRALFQNYRARVALILLVVVSLYASLNLLFARIQLYSNLPQEDPVTIHERRIEQVRKILPPVRALGYVTTVENERIFLDERNFRNVEFLAQYYLTQYTLAPVFVYNSPDHLLVVGNFLDGPADPQWIRKKELMPLRDLGDGVILYRKENP